MPLETCGLNLSKDRREQKPHGSSDFPCAGYSTSYTNHADDIIPWHWHEEMEVFYVKEGQLMLQIPGSILHLRQGDAMFINSNILHFAIAEPYCELWSLVFHPIFISGQKGSLIEKKYIKPLTSSSSLDGFVLTASDLHHSNLICKITEAFEAFSQGKTGYEFMVREALSQICFSLYQFYENSLETQEEDTDPDHLRIRIMLDYIHEHFEDRLTVPKIASSAGIGEREALHCFQRMIQSSPMQYALKYRITKGAAMLLENKSLSVSDISTQCGFNSPSNFSQIFKRYYRCTPKDYRLSPFSSNASLN